MKRGKEISKEQLYEEYIINNKSYSQIGKEYNRSKKTIRDLCFKYEFKKNNIRDILTYDILYTEYITNNKSVANIAEEFNTTKAIIHKILKEFNINKTKDDILKSMKNTNIKKYGTKYAQQSEIVKEKIKQTNLEKYGTEYGFQNEDIKNKIKQTNLEKYGSWPSVKNRHFTIINDPNLLKEFIINNYASKPTIHMLANDLGYAYSTMQQILQEYNFKDFVNYYPIITNPEKEISDYLKNLGIINIDIHNKTILNGKEIDIYLPDYKIGIEFNGSYWHSENKISKNYHQEKSLLAKEKDIFIYHIFEYEWLNEQTKQKILNNISNLLQKNSIKIYARKCEIMIVESNVKKDFLNKFHLQGNDNSSLNIGLYYNNELVAIMTFTKLRFNKKYKWELSRFCTKNNCNVIGSVSKLFKYFVINYLHTNETIITYNDFSKSRGNIYQLLGFEYQYLSSPNYVWCNKENQYKTIDHIMMKNEKENMTNAGYFRIFNSGNNVWLFTKR